ncbi:MAG: molecular chaperone [Bacteriovoracaceae bacterium]|nr:molecular chaperone [Bacteriovoracaceae bacterium]
MKSLLTLVLFLISTIAYSYTVTPIIQTFKAAGKGSSKTFLIENSSDTPVSLEFEITTRFIKKDGKETRVESEDFMVYPLQVTLKPNSKRNIRVSWVGEKKPEKELPYRMIVRQLPIKMKGDTGVKFLFEYVASLYVLPKTGVAPKLYGKITGSQLKEKKKLLHFQLNNSGKKHAITARYNFFITDGKNTHLLEERDYATKLLPNFLPGTIQIGTIFLPKNIDPTAAKLKIKKKK